MNTETRARELARDINITFEEAMMILSETQLTESTKEPVKEPIKKPIKRPDRKKAETIEKERLNTSIGSKDVFLLTELESEPEILNLALKILFEELAKYENGSGLFPYIEYCIALARDIKKKEEEHIKEESKQEEEKLFDSSLLTSEQRRQLIRDTWAKQANQFDTM